MVPLTPVVTEPLQAIELAYAGCVLYTEPTKLFFSISVMVSRPNP